MAIFTVELQGHTGSGVESFYVSSQRFNTGPEDVPAHQHFHPALQVPANFERALFSSGMTTGASSVGYGEIVIVNAHGRYDAWPDYAFDGRPCIVKAIATDDLTGKPLWSYTEAPVLIRGTVESVDVTDIYRTIRLRLYDRLADLDKPLLTARYGGTTTGGGQGADGTVDLKGTLIPRVYGTALNVSPVDVNPFDLIRQVSGTACAGIAVYDGGLGLDLAGDYASLVDLLAATVAPGRYATALALGLIRLGGTPASTLTADVVSAGPQDAAGIARQMLTDFGLPADAIDGATFTALSAKNPAPCGYAVADDQTVLAAVSAVLRSIGGWIVPDGQGVFSTGRLEVPQGEPVAIFQQWQVLDNLQRVAPGDSNRGVPAYRVVVRYGRLWRTQGESELVGAVEPARRAALALQWREAVAEDASVKDRHLLAQEMAFETCLLSQADAQAEADRLLAIYAVQRAIWQVRMSMTGLDYRADRDAGDAQAMPIDLGAVVSLEAERFLRPARRFVVIGRVEDCANNRIQFDLWG